MCHSSRGHTGPSAAGTRAGLGVCARAHSMAGSLVSAIEAAANAQHPRELRPHCDCVTARLPLSARRPPRRLPRFRPPETAPAIARLPESHRERTVWEARSLLWLPSPAVQLPFAGDCTVYATARRHCRHFGRLWHDGWVGEPELFCSRVLLSLLAGRLPAHDLLLRCYITAASIK